MMTSQARAAASPCSLRVLEMSVRRLEGQKKKKVFSGTSLWEPAVLTHTSRPEPPFTGVSGPSGPEIAKKSQKGSWGGLEKSLDKYPKKSKNTEKIPKKVRKSIFLDFFGYFSRLFSRPPQDPFETFLRFRAQRARRLL